MKECEVKRDGKRLVAKLNCEIDHHTAKLIREEVDGLVFDGINVLVLDFSGVPFMDSSGIGLILGRAAKIGEIGARLEVIGLSGRLRRLVCMSGMERISNITVK